MLTVKQADDSYPYVVKVTAFATFTLDKDGCKAAYRNHFNPAVIGVNIARLLYSTAREMIVNLTERGPYDAAKIPTLILEPADIEISFSEEKEEAILKDQFDLTEEQLQALKNKSLPIEQATLTSTNKSKARTKIAKT